MNSETRIYTTVAQDRIVDDGDPDAALLVAPAGGEVPVEYSHIYREYRKAKDEPTVVAVEPEPEVPPAQPEAKAVERAPENKARVMAEKK